MPWSAVNITSQRVGDADKGTVCPLYPRCTGKLHRQVSVSRSIPLVEHIIADCRYSPILKCKIFNSPDLEPYPARVLLPVFNERCQ
jgi:hypothetical protein